MKKLLLLALTIGSATALTACGGATKEISNFLENHTNLFEESTIEDNYTVAYTTGGKSSTFNVDGNVAYNITSKDFYDINEDGTATAWINETYYEYSESGSQSSGNAFLRKASLNATQFAAVSDNVAAAIANPFAALIAGNEDLTAENLYKEFDSEEDENGVVTLFYVGDTEAATAAESTFTVVFTYNLDGEKLTDEFATATVKTGGNTWVYSNLTNENYEFAGTAHSLTTPTGETTLEQIATLINARDNVNVTATLNYTDELDAEVTETVTAILDGEFIKITSNVNPTRYYALDENGTYTIYTYNSTYKAYGKAVAQEADDTLVALKAAMDITVDGTLFGEEVNVGSPSYRFRYTNEAMNATGNYVLVQASKLVNQNEITGTIRNFVSYDSTEGYTVSGGYTLNGLNNFDYTNNEGVSAEINGLQIFSQEVVDFTAAISSSSSNTTKNMTVITYDTDGYVLNTTYYMAAHATWGEVCLVVAADGTAELTRTYTGDSTYKYDVFDFAADDTVTLGGSNGVTNAQTTTIYNGQYVTPSYTDLTYSATAGAYIHNYGESTHKHEAHIVAGDTLEETYGVTYNWTVEDGARVDEYIKYRFTVNSANETIDTYLALVATFEAANAE